MKRQISDQQWLKFALLINMCLITVICFMPQPELTDVKTPGIIYWGRVPVLLTPFNSFVRLTEIESLPALMWIIGQNIVNIFLLYPLVFLLLLMKEKWRSYRVAAVLGLGLSLFIECGQVVLDILFDFNRVFEVDDLITNTLGAVLAYATYRVLPIKNDK